MRERRVLKFVVFSELSVDSGSQFTYSFVELLLLACVEQEASEVSQARELGLASSFRVKVG